MKYNKNNFYNYLSFCPCCENSKSPMAYKGQVFWFNIYKVKCENCGKQKISFSPTRLVKKWNKLCEK